MARVVVDPVTRIEGHLRIEIVVDEKSGKVQNAVSSGTMWRGIELILRGRDPRDAWAFAQRICGVCTSIHALASVRCIEKATPGYYRAFQEKIKKIVESGQLGIFAAHWWDHPDYKLLPPEVHLMAVAHYLNMLDV